MARWGERKPKDPSLYIKHGADNSMLKSIYFSIVLFFVSYLKIKIVNIMNIKRIMPNS